MGIKAFYPGSFDPITWGHIDLVERGLKLFDEVHVVVSGTRSKTPLFSIDERVEMAKESLSSHERVKVMSWDKLIVEYAKKHNINVLIRGLRVASDFEFEFMLTGMNRHLNPDVETVFLCTSNDLFFVSSSIIKEVSEFGGDVSQYVPPIVEKSLKEKFAL